MSHRNGTENVTVPSIISKGLFPSKSFPVAKIFSLLRSIFILISALANLSILIFLQFPAVFACNDNAVFPAFLKDYFSESNYFSLTWIWIASLYPEYILILCALTRESWDQTSSLEARFLHDWILLYTYVHYFSYQAHLRNIKYISYFMGIWRSN